VASASAASGRIAAAALVAQRKLGRWLARHTAGGGWLMRAGQNKDGKCRPTMISEEGKSHQTRVRGVPATTGTDTTRHPGGPSSSYDSRTEAHILGR
jgi:hypothetical protein